MKDLFGNDIVSSQPKLKGKIILKEKELPVKQVVPKEKKSRKKTKVEDEKPKAKVYQFGQAQLSLYKGKLLDGYTHHVECIGYPRSCNQHAFFYSEREADAYVQRMEASGEYDRIYKLPITSIITDILKSIELFNQSMNEVFIKKK